MPRRFLSRHVSARSVALGVALAGLMLAFLAASLLVFPYKAVANPEVQGELLYDLLGHLEYDAASGRFGQIADAPPMQEKLNALIVGNQLDVPPATAYIMNLGDNAVVWGTSPDPAQLSIPDIAPGYTMQFVTTQEQQIAVQNFWLRGGGGERIEFRMVVALPVR